MDYEHLAGRLHAFLAEHDMPESEDARLYRHNVRKGLAAELPEITALCRRRAMAAALRIRLRAARIRRARRVEAQRAANSA